jgi:inosose dehydratase
MLVANAPCSWGVLEFDGLDRCAPWRQVLDEIALTGYAGTELGDWAFMPTDPARLRGELASRGLAMVGAFVPVRLADATTHADGIATAVRTARLLAAIGERPVIVLADDNGRDPSRTARAGRIVRDDSLTPDGWAIFSRGCDAIAAAVREATGLRTVFHPHCAGFVETGWEIDELMRRTDPALVGLCLDTGHLTFAGADPLEVLAAHAARTWHVHAKDFDPGVFARTRAESWGYFDAVRHGVFCELGQGSVAFAAVLRDLRSAGYESWLVVEQDVLPGMGSPSESARRNRDYLRRLGV